VEVGEKLPSYIEDFVQTVISKNSPEKMDVKVGNRIYLVVFFPLSEEQRLIISGFDISDQTNLERKLQESKEELAEIQKMAHVGNWVWDIKTDKTYWSDELYSIFGRSHQESAPTYDELFNYIHPDDQHHVFNAANKALNNKSSLSIDFRIILAFGEERTVHMLSETIYDKKNCPIRIKGIVQDITGIRKSEEEIQSLANIVESSNDAIGTLSLDGIITSWNKGAEQLYGYSVKEVLGKSVSILATPYVDNETIKLIEKIKNGEDVKHYETLRLRKEGKTINVSITLSPVFDVS
jgi:PAS domain S-box-containing protein